jgi:hypothetical protein
MGSGCIALLIHSLDARSGEGVVSATPWPLYSRERTGTHCTRGWVGVGASLNGYGKSCYH